MKSTPNPLLLMIALIVCAGPFARAEEGADEKQTEALVAAAAQGDVAAATKLLDAGVDVNAKTNEGLTILMIAVAGQQGNGHEVEMMKLLLDRGAKIDAKDARGYTAAWYAAWAGLSPEGLQLLIDKGADVKAVVPKEGTILHHVGDYAPSDKMDPKEKARREDNLRKTVEILVKAGVDVNAKDAGGQTALAKFADFGEPVLVDEALAHGADVNVTDDSGRTALLNALQPSFARPPDVAMVDELLAHGADATIGTNNPAGKGDTPSPLKSAIIGGHYYANDDQQARRAMFKKLMDKGARFACEKESDTEALLTAASLGDVAKVKELLAKGVKAGAADDRGWTALMSAAGLGYNEVADALLDAGADVNARDADNFTALWLEVSCGTDPQRVEALAGRKADPNIAAAGFYGTVLGRAVLRKDIKVVETLLNAGADPNQTIGMPGQTETETALQAAVQKRQAAIVKLLLDHKADPNPRSMENRSPLYWAIDYGEVEMVKALLAAGAKTDVVSAYHESIQDEAERSDNAEIKELIRKAVGGK
ncbi:MAG TPA: ankyrin repeat domain-containing protein [Chthoniobacteraceae bacterium]|nr:ankyrin repeat domain-containing protein [Chthoniobacteraceae bacterium]